ncbi:MAG TPA: GNAT family N-acetyltransferase [Actinomycetota bacterium]|jgi:L-amino acid N-acyltransferase YncA
MDIRAADRRDVPEIAAIHVRAWRAAYAGLVDRSYLDSLSVEERAVRWREWLESPPPGMRVWVAEEDGRVLGFASTGPSRDEEAPPETAEVSTIYLAPELVGTGLGRPLFAHAVEDLRDQGYVRVELWVLTTNDRARRFYEHAGWRADGGARMDDVLGIELHEVRYVLAL